MSKPVAALTQFQTNFPFANLVSLDSNFSSLLAATNDALTYSNYLVDTSAVANTINASFAAGISATLTAGLLIQIKVAVTNTGPTSINVNSLGLIPAINPDGSAMSPGQLQAGGVYPFQYNGSNFILQGSWVSPAAQRTAAEIAASIVPVNYAYPPLNVLRYGADPTNTTDSTAAINNACLVANQMGGGKVVLPAGTYKTTATITRQANVYLVGDGPGYAPTGNQGTTIVATGNYAIISSVGNVSGVINGGGVQNMVLQGVWNTGTGAGNTASVGISESWTNRSIHRDVRFHGCYWGFYGIALWQVTWDNLHADGTGTLQNNIGFYLDQLSTTFPVGTSNSVKAVNCVAQNTNTSGFRLLNPNGSSFTSCEAMNGIVGFDIGNTGAGCYPCQFAQFVNCTSDTNSGNGWQIQQGSNASPCTFIQLSNCWGSTHGQYGMYLNGCTYINVSNFQSGNNSQGAVLLNQCQYCTISSGVFQLNNTGNNAGIGDIWIAAGSFNRVDACLSNMAHATSPSLLETNATASNSVMNSTLFQGATFLGTSGTVRRNNQGYRTETVGTANITAGNTFVTVTHNLAETPNLDSISVTPNTSLGSAAQWWVSNVTATTFQINLNANPGGTVGFSYKINLNTVY